MADGTKRLLFDPVSSYVSVVDEDPAQVEFQLVDGSGAISTAFAQATVTNAFLANPVDFNAFGTTQTESEAITAQNGTVDPTQTCLWGGAGCLTTPYAVSGVGTWDLSQDKTKVVFQANQGFTGQASIDFAVTKSGTTTTAIGTATVTVIGSPSVTPESASASAGVEVTLSPDVSATGNLVRCIYSEEPAPNPCTSSSSTSASVSWTLRSDGVVSFSSIAGFSGLVTIFYGVRDTYGQFASASMTVEVVPPAAPTVGASSGVTTTSNPVTLSPVITASTSGQTLTVCQADSSGCGASATIAGQGTFTVVGNQIRFVSINSFTGSAVAVAKVTDDIGQAATNSVTVSVSEPSAPTVGGGIGTTSPTTAVFVDPVISSPLPVTWCFVDPSNPSSCSDPLSVSGVGTWTTGSSQVKFTSVSGFSGSPTISLRITDTLGRTATGSIQVDVVSNFVAQNAAATTNAASGIGQTSATLNGQVSAGNAQASVTFCYGTAADLSGCTTVNGSPSSVNSNASSAISAAISNLNAGTTYYFRVILTDPNNSVTGATLSFQTTAATPPPAAPVSSNSSPEPTLTPISCSPAVTGNPPASTATSGIDYLAETISTLFRGIANSVVGLVNLAGGVFGMTPIATQPVVPGSAFGEAIEVLGPTGVTLLAAKKTTALAPSDITIESGTQENTVEISATGGGSLALDGEVQSVDLNLYVEYTGAELNNPLVWQNEGYGSQCWKLEPFVETWFVLPDPIQFPGAAPEGEWEYSNVIVKAGSLTADPTTFQVNTLFPGPAKGSMVWADVNANGIYDPDGKGGDKAISHIVICVKQVQASPSPTQSQQGTPTSTPSPSETSSPTVTPTPTQTPTASATPTPTATQTPEPTATSTPTPSETVAPTPTATATPTPSVTGTPVPSLTPSPTPTVTQASFPCPTPKSTLQPKFAPPSPTPTQTSIVIRLMTPTPVPSVEPTSSPTSSPAPSTGPNPTPSPSGSATPEPTGTATPEPTGTASPTPTATATPTPSGSPTPTSTPAPTSTPGPTLTPPAPPATPVPAVDPAPPAECVPSATYGVAMKLTDGLSTICYRVTSAAFFRYATNPLLSSQGGQEVESPAPTVSTEVSQGQELADTGFDTSWLVLLAMLLAGTGVLSLSVARKRD